MMMRMPTFVSQNLTLIQDVNVKDDVKSGVPSCVYVLQLISDNFSPKCSELDLEVRKFVAKLIRFIMRFTFVN